MSESNQDQVRDPVCGKVVDPLRARAVGIYGGTTRYFCSADCKGKYADPRQARSGTAPSGVERRSQESTGEHTGNWFAQGVEQSKPRPAERFVDLERPANQDASSSAPTPSLLVDVAAVKKRGSAWVWVVLGLAAGAVFLILGLRR